MCREIKREMGVTGMENRKDFLGKKILILGSAVIDVIINIDRLPQSGEDIMGMQKGQTVGGCAYNVSKILDYLKIEHDICVPVGKGMYADMIRKELQQRTHKILIEDDREDNGYSLSLVENNGERTFITMDGIETKWTTAWFQAIDASVYDYIYVSGYGFQDGNTSGDVILEFLQGKRPDCKLILDPGPRMIGSRFKDAVMKMNTILELNDHEAAAMTGEQDVWQAVKKLHALTQNPVVVTMGSKGTLYYTEQIAEIVVSRPVTAVDTIGAGDSHTAGFIAGLAAGADLPQACAMANEIAAKVVQHTGCNAE